MTNDWIPIDRSPLCRPVCFYSVKGKEEEEEEIRRSNHVERCRRASNVEEEKGHAKTLCSVYFSFPLSSLTRLFSSSHRLLPRKRRGILMTFWIKRRKELFDSLPRFKMIDIYPSSFGMPKRAGTQIGWLLQTSQKRNEISEEEKKGKK